jgi:hypothetical protein
MSDPLCVVLLLGCVFGVGEIPVSKVHSECPVIACTPGCLMSIAPFVSIRIGQCEWILGTLDKLGGGAL